MITRAIFSLLAITLCALVTGCDDTDHEGKYLNTKNPSDQLELLPHKGFSLHEQGTTIMGKYEWDERTLTLTAASGKTTTEEIRGDTLIDEQSGMWILWRSGSSDHDKELASSGSSQNDRVRHTNREAITLDLESLGSDAFQYKLRSSASVAGGGSYEGYAIDPAGQWGTGNANGAYSIRELVPAQIVLTGTSKMVDGASVTITFDGDGKNIRMTTAGW